MAENRRPANYTTQVKVSDTVAECQRLLAEAGASTVATMFEDRKPVGLSFSLPTPHGTRTFAMPVNVDGAHKLLEAASYRDLHASIAKVTAYRSRANAERVAWRVVRDWLRAQLAIIDMGMASMQEVMLPYLQIEGRTVWERYQESEQLALEAP